jgi:hypothetical protein
MKRSAANLNHSELTSHVKSIVVWRIIIPVRHYKISTTVQYLNDMERLNSLICSLDLIAESSVYEI